MEILEYCVTDRNSVIILYRKGGDDVSQDTQFVPYRIIYWKNKWYLVAYCHLRDDVWTFRVDRIESLTVTDETFEQPEDFSVDSYFMVNLLPIMENDIIFSFRNISEIVVVITFCDFNKKTK